MKTLVVILILGLTNISYANAVTLVENGAKAVKNSHCVSHVDEINLVAKAGKLSKVTLKSLSMSKVDNIQNLMALAVKENRVGFVEQFKYIKKFKNIKDGDKILFKCLTDSTCDLDKCTDTTYKLPFFSSSIVNTQTISNASISVQKVIKTFGISSLEKTLLKNAKYVLRGSKLVAQRNSTFSSYAKDALGRTNIERMKQGLAPIGRDGKAVELHHLKQKDNGLIIELTNREHNENSKILHRYKKESEIDRNAFNKFKKDYWKERAKDFE